VRRARSSQLAAALATALAVAAVAVAVMLGLGGGSSASEGPRDGGGEAANSAVRAGAGGAPIALPTPEPEAPEPPPVRFRDSVAVGLPHAGELIRSTRLPAFGDTFRTWDPVQRRVPSRAARRHATPELVRMVLGVARRYARAEPRALPMLVGDLSKPGGGRFAGAFHASHQNGLDADIYYPRLDRRERSPWNVTDIDLKLAQDLVDRFVRAGATYVFVGPRTPLKGPRGVVMALPRHDNHMHVRLPPG